MDAPGTIVQAATSPTWDELKHQHPACPACEYDLGGLPEPVCPECGGRWDVAILSPSAVSHAATRGCAAILSILPVFTGSAMIGNSLKSLFVIGRSERAAGDEALIGLLVLLAAAPCVASVMFLPRVSARALPGWLRFLVNLSMLAGVFASGAMLCAPFLLRCAC